MPDAFVELDRRERRNRAEIQDVRAIGGGEARQVENNVMSSDLTP